MNAPPARRRVKGHLIVDIPERLARYDEFISDWEFALRWHLDKAAEIQKDIDDLKTWKNQITHAMVESDHADRIQRSVNRQKSTTKPPRKKRWHTGDNGTTG